MVGRFDDIGPGYGQGREQSNPADSRWRRPRRNNGDRRGDEKRPALGPAALVWIASLSLAMTPWRDAPEQGKGRIFAAVIASDSEAIQTRVTRSMKRFVHGHGQGIKIRHATARHAARCWSITNFTTT